MNATPSAICRLQNTLPIGARSNVWPVNRSDGAYGEQVRQPFANRAGGSSQSRNTT